MVNIKLAPLKAIESVACYIIIIIIYYYYVDLVIYYSLVLCHTRGSTLLFIIV